MTLISSYNVSNAFFSTAVPWVFIFGISCCCLVLIPGWLRVFSNTFGVSFSKMAGLNDAVIEIFGDKSKISEVDAELKQTIELLYSSKSQYVNEIDLDCEFDDQGQVRSWPSLERLLNFMKIDQKESSLKTNLYNKLSIKEDVGYFVWFILIGSISVLVSTNSLLVSKCGNVDMG